MQYTVISAKHPILWHTNILLLRGILFSFSYSASQNTHLSAQQLAVPKSLQSIAKQSYNIAVDISILWHVRDKATYTAMCSSMFPL